MPYGLLDDGIAGNPKFDNLSDAACWVWILSISYANKGLTDGYLTREQAARLLRQRGHGPKVLAELTTAHPPYGPLWEIDGDGYRIHHFFENKNRSRAAIEQLKADRALAGQIGGLTAHLSRAGPREASAIANAQASAIAKQLPNGPANAVAKRQQNPTPDPVPRTPVPGERQEGISVSGSGSDMKNTAMKSMPENAENGSGAIGDVAIEPGWTAEQEAERVAKLKQKAHELRDKKRRESDARFGVVRASDVGPVGRR